MIVKICKKCDIEKDISFFYLKKDNKDGYSTNCKECNIIYSREYREKNTEIINEQRKEYREKNTENIKKRNKEYHEKNKQEINEKMKNRLKNDALLKLTQRIRQNVCNSFRHKSFRKNNKTANILGCSFEEFKLHLESQFEDWMTWDNRGLYNGELYYGWDIDHKIPLASAETEEDIIRLNHYTNLQPLCGYTNRHIKKDRL